MHSQLVNRWDRLRRGCVRPGPSDAYVSGTNEQGNSYRSHWHADHDSLCASHRTSAWAERLSGRDVRSARYRPPDPFAHGRSVRDPVCRRGSVTRGTFVIPSRAHAKASDDTHPSPNDHDANASPNDATAAYGQPLGCNADADEGSELGCSAYAPWTAGDRWVPHLWRSTA